MAHLLIFGDSITYGAWDEEGGWAQRLRKHLDKKVIESNHQLFYLTYNLGVSGDTSKDLLERFDAEAKCRLDPTEETIFLFSIGTNDAIFNNKTRTHWIPEEEYAKNLEALITKAKKYSSKIIFLGLTPVDESKVDPIPWVENCSSKNEYIEKYNALVEKVCKENNAHFIEIFHTLLTEDYVNLLADGDHPNIEGHKRTFEIVKEYLEENRVI